jgi:hypothetical protein
MSGANTSNLTLCDPYVWEDPRYIVHSIHKQDIKCASELVNKTVFVYILSMIIAFVLSAIVHVKGLFILMGILATLYLIPTFLKLRAVEQFRNNGGPIPKENYMNKVEREEKEEIEGFYVKEDKTAMNPFENVTVDQYKYAPTKGAADVSSKDLDTFFRVQWSSDPTDVFGKTQSQRMFYTTPNTTIPNDQGSFQDWLYKIPGLTCKEGNGAACWGGTSGAAIPWLN